jgi:hypothetical protein
MFYKRWAVLSLMLVFCLMSIVSARGLLFRKRDVTFSKDVAPIFYNNCVACHRPNNIAPMSLLTYQETRPWARSIREKILTKQMPPWHADPRYGEFANDVRLSQKEIDTIVAWVDQGSKEGNAKDLPSAPEFNDEWEIGKPDIIFPIPQEYTLSATGEIEDQYEYFTVATNFTEDKWVQAVELRPGNRKIVHHAHVDIEAPYKPAAAGDAEKKTTPTVDPWVKYFEKVAGLNRLRMDLPAIDDGCSVPNGGYFPEVDASSHGGPLGSYVPGKAPDVWAPGMAKKIPAGSKLRFQIHYARTTGQVEKDRTSVGLIFAKEPPKHVVKRVDVTNFFFKIPPGAPNHEVTACYTFKEDVLALSYLVHMHYRGKDMKFEAIYPNGKREVLLSVPNYNFNWQTVYRLKKPVSLPKGTKIVVTSHFDNSARNKYNPDPTQILRWGDSTDFEMCDGWIEYISANKSTGLVITKETSKKR